jgi:hypothetical protein
MRQAVSVLEHSFTFFSSGSVISPRTHYDGAVPLSDEVRQQVAQELAQSYVENLIMVTKANVMASLSS